MTQAPPASPSAKRTVLVDGFHLAYVDRGPGQDQIVVFLHGNPSSSYLWRHLIAALDDRYRCLAPDLIGMGDSDKLPAGDPYDYATHQRFLDAAHRPPRELRSARRERPRPAAQHRRALHPRPRRRLGRLDPACLRYAAPQARKSLETLRAFDELTQVRTASQLYRAQPDPPSARPDPDELTVALRALLDAPGTRLFDA